jgi:periplasmic protein TonB
MSALAIAMILTGVGGLAQAQAEKPAPMYPPVPMVVLPPAPTPLRPPGTVGAYPYPVIMAPPRPPPPLRTPPRRARSNLQTYFSPDDYPAPALRAEAQGVTSVRLIIGPDGRVSDCVVTASSGTAALDAATCRILHTRARYFPARDATGTATSGGDEGRIRWTLPAE